jgi:hypothetical protein
MSELIVLGQIPGTHIQITFIVWIVLIVGASVAALFWLSRFILVAWVITLRLLALTRRTPVNLEQ